MNKESFVFNAEKGFIMFKDIRFALNTGKLLN